MKVRLPLVIQDPSTSRIENLSPTEGFDATEDFYLDGPITARVAVLDFSPKTGELMQGAYFRSPPPGKVRGWYSWTKEGAKNDVYDAKADQLYSSMFMQTSVFASVLKTMHLFEEGKENTESDVLGRKLKWGFNAPQLLIVPRAGEMANAFYHRDSHSLQFFYFSSPNRPEKKIFTSLNRDVIAHETGHAIVDGIVPDLLDACTPESLAIHEAIADLTALLMAFDSHKLAPKVLDQTNGSLEAASSTAFSSIAESVGKALYPDREGLRELNNDKTLDPEGKENFVRGDSPHALSEVLSGVMFKTMVKIHEHLKPIIAKKARYANKEDPLFSASGEALWVGAKRLRRMIFRPLDLLPPGEVSFADYGRAIIAADQIAYPDDEEMRSWIIDEFVKRHIVEDKRALQVQANFDYGPLKEVDMDDLLNSDWLAYDFVNKNRELFCLPPGTPIPFQVRPRLSVKKKYAKNNPMGELGHECIFKIAWQHEEPNLIGSGHAQKREITVGSTLVIDWKTKKILARLTSAPPTTFRLKCQKLDSDQQKIAKKEYEKQRKARDKHLSRLADEGLLELSKYARDQNGNPIKSLVMAEVSDGIMRVKNTGNMLHVIGHGGAL